MSLLPQVASGFQTIEADAALEQALKYLEQWLTDAPFAAYRPQVEWLIEQKQWAGLLDRFYQIMPFGTGGRRGAVGIGPNRMNLWTLGASVQGHCEYLKENFPGVEPLRVVLAYDVRQFEDKNKNYNPKLPNPVLHVSSKSMAQYAAGVYTANGLHAWILPDSSPRFLATPELSFAIRLLQAHGGLNISASHNPPDDNGGKFYDERGGQPVPPEDQLMADLVDQVTTIKHLAWEDAVRTGRVHFLDDNHHRGYIDLCCKQSLVSTPRGDEFKVVFTPLHGVGSMTAMEILQKQGFKVLPVAEQLKPDGQFPNVTKTPNPEVPESLDRAIALAQKEHADLVLATDPDADRLGAAVAAKIDKPGQRAADWPMQFVNGNAIAALLTHFKLAKLAEKADMPRSPIVIRTIVTTSLVTKIARQYGAQVVDNLLVGFKYPADVLYHLEKDGKYEDVQGTPADFVIATEESHGILLTAQMRDKDAGAAALAFAELSLDLKRKGLTVPDYLEMIERQFGYHKSDLLNIVMTGIAGKQEMNKMLDSLRQQPPKTIGGLAVTGFDDLRDENGWMGPFKGKTDAAARNFLIFQLGEQARLALRPSGTEPKAKAYMEVVTSPCKPDTPLAKWQQIKQEADALVKRIGQDFLAQAMVRVGKG